jgi:hypothetical protein
MARKVFFSFYYDGDGWRASQVRNMGALEGNAPCSDNDWELLKKAEIRLSKSGLPSSSWAGPAPWSSLAERLLTASG